MPGINEGKRRRKLAVNKDKCLFKITRTLSIALLAFDWLLTSIKSHWLKSVDYLAAES